MTAKHMPI